MQVNREMRTGIALDVWGPSAWNTLHCFAHASPPRISDSKREEFSQFLSLFAKQIPCPSCRHHFEHYLETNPLKVETRGDLVSYLNDAHNSVNKRLGKKTWSYEAHCRAYMRPRPTVPFFEWSMLALIIAVYFRRKKKIHV
jgi:hypothetical protein